MPSAIFKIITGAEKSEHETCSEASGGNFSGVVKEIRSWKNLFTALVLLQMSLGAQILSLIILLGMRFHWIRIQGRHLWFGQPHDPNVAPSSF